MWGSSEALSLLKSRLSSTPATSERSQERVANTFNMHHRSLQSEKLAPAAPVAAADVASTIAALKAAPVASRAAAAIPVPVLPSAVPIMQTVTEAAEARSLKKVVLDSGSFIGDARSERLGPDCEYFTIEEVVDEIKDARSQAIFDAFPYPIKIVPVFASSLRAVSEASKATGDYYALSAVDRKVLALAYQLETGSHGTVNLRDGAHGEAAAARRRADHEARLAAKAAAPAGGAAAAREGEDEEDDDAVVARARLCDDVAVCPFDAALFVTGTADDFWGFTGATPEVEAEETVEAVAAVSVPEPEPEAAAPAVSAVAEPAAEEEEEGEEAWETAPAKPAKKQQSAAKKASKPKALPVFGSGEWVTPAMMGVKSKAAAAKPTSAAAAGPVPALVPVGPAPAAAGAPAAAAATPTDAAAPKPAAAAAAASSSSAAKPLSAGAAAFTGAGANERIPTAASSKLPRSVSTVGLLTLDVSMQNVSLHCGLRVLTTSAAFMIRRQQRYVLRCSSCFTVCADMSRAFCPSCGGHTLFRASVETNARGEDTYQWRQGFRQMSSKRGTRYAIPKMLGGRLGKIKDLRLREDVMPGRRHRDVKAAAAAALGVVASTDGGFDGLGASFGEVRNERRQEVVVGYGRRNPNVVRKR